MCLHCDYYYEKVCRSWCVRLKVLRIIFLSSLISIIVIRMSLWSLFLSRTSLTKFEMLALSWVSSTWISGIQATLNPWVRQGFGTLVLPPHPTARMLVSFWTSTSFLELTSFLRVQPAGNTGKMALVAAVWITWGARAVRNTQFVNSRCIGPSESTECCSGLMHYALRLAGHPGLAVWEKSCTRNIWWTDWNVKMSLRINEWRCSCASKRQCRQDDRQPAGCSWAQNSRRLPWRFMVCMQREVLCGEKNKQKCSSTYVP